MSTSVLAEPEAAGPSERDLDLRYYAGLLWGSRSFLLAAALVGLLLEDRAACLYGLEANDPVEAVPGIERRLERLSHLSAHVQKYSHREPVV